MAKIRINGFRAAKVDASQVTTVLRVYNLIKDVTGIDGHPFKTGEQFIIWLTNHEKMSFDQIVLLDSILYRYKNIGLVAATRKGKPKKVTIDTLLDVAKFKRINVYIPKDLALKVSRSGNEYYYNEYADNYFSGNSTPHYWALRDFKAQLRLAKKALRKVQVIEELEYVKEFSCYSGDYLGKCDAKEATDVRNVEVVRTYLQHRYLVVNGEMYNVRTKDKQNILSLGCPKWINPLGLTKEDVKSDYYTFYYTKPEDDLYKSTFRRLFNLTGLDITAEVIDWLLNTLVNKCSEYVENNDLGALEFVKNMINIHTRYDEFVDMSGILRLPSIVDFVVGEFIHDRDIEVESFYEDRKDDDYEEINSSYLGEDE